MQDLLSGEGRFFKALRELYSIYVRLMLLPSLPSAQYGYQIKTPFCCESLAERGGRFSKNTIVEEETVKEEP
jgi:hypothetical protein